MASSVTGVQKILWWFAAADPQILSKMKSRSQMAMSALGLVFLFNFMVLVFIWSKVGFSFFGFLGVIAPGILVPSTMLLLDRVVSLGVIKRHQALKKYSGSTTNHGSGYLMWRVFVALCFSFATSFVFMLDLSDSLIKEQLSRDARVQNETLRDKYASRINDSLEVDLNKLTERKAVLTERMNFLQGKYQESDKLAQEALEQASVARAEAASERAGLGSRIGGAGPKYKANMAIYKERTEFAKKQQTEAEASKREMDKVELELSQVNERLSEVDRERQKELSSIDAQLRGDLRYVPIADGFFAKSSAFLELFKDDERGIGILATTVMLFVVLFLLEMAGFIAILMMPVVPYYIALTADNEQEIARIVAESDANIKKYQQGDLPNDKAKAVSPPPKPLPKPASGSADNKKPSEVVAKAVLNQPSKKPADAKSDVKEGAKGGAQKVAAEKKTDENKPSPKPAGAKKVEETKKSTESPKKPEEKGAGKQPVLASGEKSAPNSPKVTASTSASLAKTSPVMSAKKSDRPMRTKTPVERFSRLFKTHKPKSDEANKKSSA